MLGKIAQSQSKDKERLEKKETIWEKTEAVFSECKSMQLIVIVMQLLNFI
jgi:hypothetical protein